MSWFNILKLSAKQKKIAELAEPKDKIDEKDLEELREGEPIVKAVEYTIGNSPRSLLHGTGEEGKVVKLPKGMRIGQSNNFIVESIHEIIMKNPKISARAIIGNLYADGKVKAGSIPDKYKVATYLKINANVYSYDDSRQGWSVR